MTDHTPPEAEPPMLDVNPDDVCQLIQLARDFHAQDAVVLPDETPGPSSDLLAATFSGHAGDPILEQFRSVVTDLERDQQVQLVALLWLGRGDYGPEEWQTALADADAEWTDYTADYLLAHPLVADQLNEGLALLGYSCD